MSTISEEPKGKKHIVFNIDIILWITISLSASAPTLSQSPFSTILFGFYGIIPEFGPLGIIGFAFVGFLWALFLGFIAKCLMRREAQREWFANTPVFLSIMALGLMSGAGIMYMFMMNAGASAFHRSPMPFFLRSCSQPSRIISLLTA